jgi:DNA-directed RNA polymerase specialized sigma subunit
MQLLEIQKPKPSTIKQMRRRRQKTYPTLTREQQLLVQEHKWIAGRLAHGAKCLTGGHTGSLTREDLESIANFALCVAATKYDPDKMVQFSTYAWKYAQGYIRHALRDYSRLVKTPRWVAQHKKEVEVLLKENRSYSEIAKELDIGESKVLMIEMVSNNYHVSYDNSPDDWVSKEFIYNDDDVKPYVLSKPLVEAMGSLSEAEVLMLVKYTEKAEMPDEEREWAADKFTELQSIAYGFAGG